MKPVSDAELIARVDRVDARTEARRAAQTAAADATDSTVVPDNEKVTFPAVPAAPVITDVSFVDTVPALVPAAQSQAVAPAGYDYATVADDVAKAVQAATTRIKAAQRAAVLDVGRELRAVKAALPHGQFGPWLHAELNVTVRSAENYMSAADFAEGNSEIIAFLPPTAIYELAAPSTPEAARLEVVEKVRHGTVMTVKMIKAIVSGAKLRAEKEAEKAKKAKRRAGLTPKAVKREERRERETLKAEADWLRQSANADRLVGIIVAALAGNEEASQLAADCYRYGLCNVVDQLTRGVQA